MAVTIKDILTLNSTKGFHLEAGKEGLLKPVEMFDMLDFGWNREKEYSTPTNLGRPLFDEASFVISSLQFADGDAGKLYDTIRKLAQCGVSGMAYKPAFFARMPRDVRNFADEAKFPIFRIENGTPYREIIIEGTDLIDCNQSASESTGVLSRMMHETLDAEEVAHLAARLSPYFRGNARITAVAPGGEGHAFSIENAIYRLRHYEEFKGKAVLSGIDLGTHIGLAVIVTADTEQENTFRVITRNVLDTCAIDMEQVVLATSEIHPTFTMLDICVSEARQAYIASRVMEKRKMKYAEMGTLSYLIPVANSAAVRTFMQTTLQPIILNEENVRSAIEYVRCEGDFTAAAEKLCVHKNTLRYRIHKIHEMIAPKESAEAFYETLSAAVKIYLIRQFLPFERNPARRTDFS